MTTLLLIVHVMVCIALIVIVLLQMGKGASIGASFGAGAAGTQFGPTSGTSTVGKITAAAAVVFMLTSLGLTLTYKSDSANTVMPAQVQPASQEAPAETK